MNSNRILIVGAGLSGAVIARQIAENTDLKLLVIDERSHIAGNCHTERDARSNVMVHRYGPHIFNTDDLNVWKYVNRFMEFRPFTNRVKAVTSRGIFGLPINLHTINQFFGKSFSPSEARAFVESQGDRSILDPKSFEEQALRFLGRDLYETFFYGYTKKQWGCEPRELSASILKRLPVRFNYDDNYYSTKIQGIPVEGYTKMVERMLDHPSIEVRLGRRFERGEQDEFNHTFYSGPIDGYYDYSLGRLGYRTVTFQPIEADGDFQGNAVLNYPGADVPWTRIHEHKHFTPWESHERTIAFKEYSKATSATDTPYYPIRSASDLSLLGAYQALSRENARVTFVGRLGTYQYLDMDDVIAESLATASTFLESVSGNSKSSAAAA